MSSSFANQTIAQIELYTRNEAYKSGEVYVLPKHLDEKVARLHLKKLGVNLTTLRKDQPTTSACRSKVLTSRITTATDACSKIGDATPCRRGVFRFQGRPQPGRRVPELQDWRLSMSMILVWILNAVALLAVAYLLPGITVASFSS